MNIKLAELDTELQGILDLQKLNLKDHVDDIEKAAQGFVTFQHSFDLMKSMNDAQQHVIGVDNNKVVAYALTMIKTFEQSLPAARPFFNLLKEIPFGNSFLFEQNMYAMGQVCIDKAYRGKGVFEKLYALHKGQFSNKFDYIVTEVSTSNPRSLKAHENVGFETIFKFRDDSDEWNILVWDWN